MSSEPTVTITRRGEQRFRHGHLWVYRSDLENVQASGGDLVRVVGPRHVALGRALYSDRSQIALRLLSRADEPFGLEAWGARLDEAIAYRARLGIDGTAYRLVHGEGDLLPSLIVDRYGDTLVLQALSQAVDRLQGELTELLRQKTGARGVLARNDARVRTLEGLPRTIELLAGEVPERIAIRDGTLEYEVNPWKDQKTGLFLDQRENRDAAAAYARGRLLDCFSYHGGFALRLARHCSSVLAIDISESAVDRIRDNAARNGLEIVARAGNVFDELRDFDRGGQRFDTIVLDPPAFAKHADALPRATAGYKEINLRALKLLEPGGTLVTCSCSYHVTEADFGEIIFEAALDAGAVVTVVEKRMQGRDHPVLLGVPETYYLKCFILRKLA